MRIEWAAVGPAFDLPQAASAEFFPTRRSDQCAAVQRLYRTDVAGRWRLT
jgi:hypothetical protein